ncbi:WbqC family protein [Cryomorphaceae bacterium 1068]|nr:WbqC family protein [Cryomorphaceae bacterium 1068]
MSDELLIVSPLSLIPPIGLFVAMAKGHKVYFDTAENYVKQTIRNRYHILSANGVQTLTINVVGQKGEKTPSGNILIDYDEPWIRLHKRALESSYRSSPFFDHYYPKVINLFEARHPDFGAFFRESLNLWLRLLKFEPNFSIQDKYVEIDADYDLRTRIKSPDQFPAEFQSKKYLQVFSDRFDFQPNLSILDLLFNEGPASLSVLKG